MAVLLITSVACIMLYLSSCNNLYFLLMEQEHLNYQALLALVRELKKDEKIDLSSLPTQNLLEVGMNRATSLRMESMGKKQLIKFCEQLAQAKPIQEMKVFQETLTDLLNKRTIDYILQLQVFNNHLADLFLDISKKEGKQTKGLKLKVNSMLKLIFYRSHHRPKMQQYKDLIRFLQHKILGWVNCEDTQNFVDQYKRRGNQIIGLKEDLQQYKRINRDQAQHMKSSIGALEELRRRLKLYQGKQIMQANQQEEFEKIDHQFIQKQPSIIELQGYSCAIAIEPTAKLAAINQIDVLVQPTSCSVDHSQSQTELLLQTNATQTDEKNFGQAGTQTQMTRMGQFEIQTERPLHEYQQVQTISIQQLLQQHQYLLRNSLRCQALFQGDVFLNDTVYRQRLIKHIQEKGRRVIRQTRMIYRYDPLNPVNFHRYIDNVQGLTFVVKTISGMYLAGFYSGKLLPDKVLNQFGLIISLNNDESYTLLDDEKGKIHRSMVYDNFYAIFGNAQLRVKTGQDFIFSNFGIMNAYFNHKGKKVNEFLGDNINREAKFEIYEFYQVLFEQ